ncbi:SLC13 family permease [Blastopirellula sp. JC732]|uniref:SLC13 family permease n=1 Tax=Blastopirellula sediminis TaxID=2894196 RepID=A0A9X1SG58_9BACT|nr:SLC13 family permease [Blastopirellula sediminis]MCC9608636.1 SLC13 family permease [Blastopirellula sediminis]MCC9628587.1 SLC13 family permease [Blastopirellula sediminis]
MIELGMVLALLATAIAMFAINKPRMDAVALIMLVALPLTGVITVNESLAGFSDPNIVLIAALFVIGDGLVRTGVARTLGDWLAGKAGSNEIRLITMLMLTVGSLGAFMSSTAITAIFIPVVLRISQGTGASTGRLMMPLSSAALVSGMMTLIATAPNLVVTSELERNGFDGFHFFSFTPFGIPILFVAVGYMLFARNWLGASEKMAQAPGGTSLAQWIDEYQLAGREHRVLVTAGSSLAGKTLEEVRNENQSGAKIIAIERGNLLIQPTNKTALEAGDVLLIDLRAEEATVKALREQYALEALPLSGGYFTSRAQDIGMAEVLLPASSALIGKSLVESHFYDEYDLRVVGLRRGTTAWPGKLEEEDLRVGDTLLVIGTWRAIQMLQTHSEDLVLYKVPVEIEEVLPAPGKGLQAVICLVIVVGLMVSGVVPNVIAALIGGLLMGALGIVNLTSAYRSIDWKTLVLIVGMLPFSIALQKTGGVDLLADGLMMVIGGMEWRVVLAAIFVITAVLGMFISNTATAVLMAPVAIALAKEFDASPYPFVMIVALAASAAFMTPVSSPVNTLVVTPGNYSFGDFVKIGVPLTILVMIVSVILVPILLPF